MIIGAGGGGGRYYKDPMYRILPDENGDLRSAHDAGSLTVGKVSAGGAVTQVHPGKVQWVESTQNEVEVRAARVMNEAFAEAAPPRTGTAEWIESNRDAVEACSAWAMNATVKRVVPLPLSDDNLKALQIQLREGMERFAAQTFGGIVPQVAQQRANALQPETFNERVVRANLEMIAAQEQQRAAELRDFERNKSFVSIDQLKKEAELKRLHPMMSMQGHTLGAAEVANRPTDVLPPDPDATGSLHWLEHNGYLWPARWTSKREWVVLGYASPSEATGPAWTYHSQMIVPAPKERTDPDLDRIWDAVKDFGK